MRKLSKQGRWLLCAAFFATGSLHAEVFTHKDGADHFEVVVAENKLIVKERYEGASTIYGDLSCPLGPAVRATWVAGSKLCLAFAKQRCRYTRFQNGNAIHKEELANARTPLMCIALANDEDAQRLASLVNAGPQPHPLPPSAASATVSKPNVTAPASTAPSKPVKQTLADTPAAGRQAAAVKGKQEPRNTEKANSAAAKPVFSARAKISAPALKSHHDNDQGAENGRWTTSSFTIGLGANARLTERTYATASIVDEDGAARMPGGHLYLRNESAKYPLYYGLGHLAKHKLEPGEEETVSLAPRRSGSRVPITQQSVTVRWFEEPAGESAAIYASPKSRSSKQDDHAEARRIVPYGVGRNAGAVVQSFGGNHTNGTSGKWITSSFVVGLVDNPRLAEETYVSASIVDDSGARRPGRHLYIRNESDKYLLLYGLGTAPKSKLEPGEEVLISIVPDRMGPHAAINQQAVAFVWFDETANVENR